MSREVLFYGGGILFCSECGIKNPKGSKFCGNCGQAFNVAIVDEKNPNSMVKEKKDTNYEEAQLKLQKENLRIQRQQLAEQKKQLRNIAKCPRCGSTSLSGHKKGFGIGKAVVGTFVAGPIGLVAGNIGAKKVRVTCLNCGKKFKV